MWAEVSPPLPQPAFTSGWFEDNRPAVGGDAAQQRLSAPLLHICRWRKRIPLFGPQNEGMCSCGLLPQQQAFVPPPQH